MEIALSLQVLPYFIAHPFPTSPSPCQMGPMATPSTGSTRKQRGNIYKWCTAHAPFPFCLSHPTLARSWAALSLQGAAISLRVLSARLGLKLWALWEDVISSTALQSVPAAACWEKAGMQFQHGGNALALLDQGWDLLTCLLNSSHFFKLQVVVQKCTNLEVHLNICVFHPVVPSSPSASFGTGIRS